MPTDREPPPVDLDEGERLCRMARDYGGFSDNYWKLWVKVNAESMLARLRWAETELARREGKEPHA